MQWLNASASDPNASCTVDHDFQRVYLHPFYIFVTLVSLLGNAVAIWVFCRFMRPWSPITIYMFNLALADLLYACSLPLLVDYYGRRRGWSFGNAACKACRFVFHLNLSASVSFVAMISAHRCLAIVRPHRSAAFTADRRLAWRTSLAAWALLVPLVAPSVYFSRAEPHGGRVVCFDTAPQWLLRRYQPYSLAVSAIGFALPLAVVLACYTLIAATLAGSSSVRAPVKARILALIALVLFTFSVNFLPYHVLRNVNVAVRLAAARGPSGGDPSCAAVRAVYVAYQVSRSLAALNTCLDPLIYTVATERVRERIVTRPGQLCGRHNGRAAA